MATPTCALDAVGTNGIATANNSERMTLIRIMSPLAECPFGCPVSVATSMLGLRVDEDIRTVSILEAHSHHNWSDRRVCSHLLNSNSTTPEVRWEKAAPAVLDISLSGSLALEWLDPLI